MELLGAEVAPVEAGARTLKEAVSAAIRDWVTNVADTHYIIGSAVGPAPYPALVRDLQRVIGDEAREQVLGGRGRAARPGDRLRRRRLERDRHLRPLRRRRRRRADRRRGGGGGARQRPPRRLAHRRARPASCTARSRRCSPTRTARSSRRTRSPPGSTTPASGPSTRTCATPAAPATWRSPTTRRCAPSASSRGSRGSSRRSSPRTRSPGCSANAGGRRAASTSSRSQRPRRQGPRRGVERLGRRSIGSTRWLSAAPSGSPPPSPPPASEGRAALMPYLMGGFPDLETSAAVADAYADSGADLIELGVPYSDPLADGPVIHAAGDRRARGRGDARRGARDLRAASPPACRCVPMVYANMVLAARPRALRARRSPTPARRGRSSPTCRPRRAASRAPRCAPRGLALIPLRRADDAAGAPGADLRRGARASSTSSPTPGRPASARSCRRELGRAGRGGSGRRRRSRSRSGFGIGTPEQAAEVGAIADGVIIGTRLVRAVGEAGSAAEAAARR